MQVFRAKMAAAGAAEGAAEAGTSVPDAAAAGDAAAAAAEPAAAACDSELAHWATVGEAGLEEAEPVGPEATFSQDSCPAAAAAEAAADGGSRLTGQPSRSGGDGDGKLQHFEQQEEPAGAEPCPPAEEPTNIAEARFSSAGAGPHFAAPRVAAATPLEAGHAEAATSTRGREGGVAPSSPASSLVASQQPQAAAAALAALRAPLAQPAAADVPGRRVAELEQQRAAQEAEAAEAQVGLIFALAEFEPLVRAESWG